jgi:NTE family protein
MDLVVIQQLMQDTERYSSRAEIITVPPICPQAVAAYEFSRAAELIDAAARSTRLWLASAGLRVNGSARDQDRSGSPTGPRVAGAATGKHALCGANLPSYSI